MTLHEKATRFRQLHQGPDVLLMPNAWDPGSARMLAASGFASIATTSAGIAYSLGLPDYEGRLSRSEMLDRVQQIAAAVDLPVNADLEAGYGISPPEVAETIRLSIQAGVAGGNIEDYTGDTSAPLHALPLAAERIRAARETADASGLPYTLTARTDCFLACIEQPFDEAVRRCRSYLEAGADCLFVPGLKDADTIRRLVQETSAPLNVVMGLTGNPMTVADLASLGVRRISIGGSLARATFGLIRRAAQEMREHGTFQYAAQQIPDDEMCRFFDQWPQDD